MSQTASPTRPPAGGLDLSSTSPIPFTRLVKVELRKSYDTRAGFWLLAVTAGLAALVMVITLIAAAVEGFAIEFGTLLATTTYTTTLLLPVLGIMLVTSEWGQRTSMTTFTLEPHRARVVLAKLVAGLVLALLVAVVAVVAAVVSNLLYGAVSSNPTSWELGETSLPGFLVLQGIGMLTGFALAALLLNTAAAIVVFFAYSFVLPAVFAITSGLIGWVADVRPWVDFGNAQVPLFDWSMDGVEYAHLLVSGLIWLVLPLALGLWRVLRAEVK